MTDTPVLEEPGAIPDPRTDHSPTMTDGALD